MFGRKKTLLVGGAGFIGRNLWSKWSVPERTVFDLSFGQDVLDGIEGKWDTIVFLAVDMGRTARALAYNKELYRALDDYMYKYPDTHVIYTSSAAVYGDSNEPRTERSLTGPVNLYGQSKLLGEAYVQQYQRHTILRLSNVHDRGAGHGVWDSFVNGNRRIHGDGSQVRDYIA